MNKNLKLYNGYIIEEFVTTLPGQNGLFAVLLLGQAYGPGEAGLLASFSSYENN